MTWKSLKPKERHMRILSLKVLDLMRDGKSLTNASKEFGLTREQTRPHISSAIYRRKGKLVAKKRDFIERRLNIYSEGKIKSILVSDSKYASRVGKYYNDVKKALETRDVSILKKYRRRKVKDSKGKWHKLETKLDKIHDIEEAKEEPEFFEIYRV